MHAVRQQQLVCNNAFITFKVFKGAMESRAHNFIKVLWQNDAFTGG